MTTPDPLELLRQPVTPLDPRPEFTAGLRERLERELRPPTPPGGTVPTTTTSATPHIPQRLHAITPYLAVDDARAAMAWYREVFEATIEAEPIIMDDGRVGHVELRIGDSLFMMADEFPEIDVRGPRSLGGTTVSFIVHVPDVDTVHSRAVAAGATPERPVGEAYGSRSGWVLDPWGHRWNIATALEALPRRSDPSPL
jgi:uncharacterized glyoxalase superfamily protein PhnB